MGVLADGTVVPTPRERNCSESYTADMRKIARAGVAFELYYADGTVREGTTVEEWDALPEQDVQLMVVKCSDGTVQQITCVGSYSYQPGSKPKDGHWADDTWYFVTLPLLVEDTSELL